MSKRIPKIWVRDPGAYPMMTLVPIWAGIAGYFGYREYTRNHSLLHTPKSVRAPVLEFYAHPEYDVELPYEQFGQAALPPDTPFPYSKWRILYDKGAFGGKDNRVPQPQPGPQPDEVSWTKRLMAPLASNATHTEKVDIGSDSTVIVIKTDEPVEVIPPLRAPIADTVVPTPFLDQANEEHKAEGRLDAYSNVSSLKVDRPVLSVESHPHESLREKISAKFHKHVTEPFERNVEEPFKRNIEEPIREAFQHKVEEPFERNVEQPIKEKIRKEKMKGSLRERFHKEVEEPVRETFHDKVEEPFERNVERPIKQKIQKEKLKGSLRDRFHKEVEEPFERNIEQPIKQKIEKEKLKGSLSDRFHKEVEEPIRETFHDKVEEPFKRKIEQPLKEKMNEPLHIREKFHNNVSEPIRETFHHRVTEPIQHHILEPVKRLMHSSKPIEPVTEQNKLTLDTQTQKALQSFTPVLVPSSASSSSSSSTPTLIATRDLTADTNPTLRVVLGADPRDRNFVESSSSSSVSGKSTLRSSTLSQPTDTNSTLRVMLGSDPRVDLPTTSSSTPSISGKNKLSTSTLSQVQQQADTNSTLRVMLGSDPRDDIATVRPSSSVLSRPTSAISPRNQPADTHSTLRVMLGSEPLDARVPVVPEQNQLLRDTQTQKLLHPLSSVSPPRSPAIGQNKLTRDTLTEKKLNLDEHVYLDKHGKRIPPLDYSPLTRDTLTERISHPSRQPEDPSPTLRVMLGSDPRDTGAVEGWKMPQQHPLAPTHPHIPKQSLKEKLHLSELSSARPNSLEDPRPTMRVMLGSDPSMPNTDMPGKQL